MSIICFQIVSIGSGCFSFVFRIGNLKTEICCIKKPSFKTRLFYTRSFKLFTECLNYFFQLELQSGFLQK
jgi:hypothetical protein